MIDKSIRQYYQDGEKVTKDYNEIKNWIMENPEAVTPKNVKYIRDLKKKKVFVTPTDLLKKIS